MAAESIQCPNCKRPCVAREGLWQKVTCVNSTCRTKFLISVPSANQVLIKTAEAEPSHQSAFKSPPLRASDPELESDKEVVPPKTRSKAEIRSRQNKILVIASVALVAIPASLMLAVLTVFPDYSSRPLLLSTTEFQHQVDDSEKSLGSKDSRGFGSVGFGSVGSNSGGSGSVGSSGGSKASNTSRTAGANTPAEPHADLDLLKFLDLSYGSISAMNLHPDAPAANQLVRDWQQAYDDRLDKLSSDQSVAALFRGIGEELKRAVHYLTVELRESAEVAEAKIRFCECLRNATKIADQVWAITLSGSGSTQASTRFQHNAIKFIKEARAIASVLRGVNASNPGNRVAEDMNEFDRRLTEKIAFFSAMPQDSQSAGICLKTVYDCLLRATKTYQTIHSIRNNPENKAIESGEEVSRLVQLFYADLRLGQELIELEESVLKTWKQQETLVRTTGRM